MSLYKELWLAIVFLLILAFGGNLIVNSTACSLQPVRQLRPVAGLIVTSGGGDDRLTSRRIVASLLT